MVEEKECSVCTKKFIKKSHNHRRCLECTNHINHELSRLSSKHKRIRTAAKLNNQQQNKP